MKNKLVSLSVTLLFLGLVGIAPAILSQRGVMPIALASAQESQSSSPAQTDITDTLNRHNNTFTIDLAIDARTIKLNRGLPVTEALRGDNFIIEGKIFPGGTIPRGGTETEPGPFDPDAPGSIGSWTCRGTFNFDFAEILAGAVPHVTSTQIYQLDNGSGLWSDGKEGGMKVTRAVIGGVGKFSGAIGEVHQEPLGINRTGLANYRFTFKLKRQSRW